MSLEQRTLCAESTGPIRSLYSRGSTTEPTLVATLVHQSRFRFLCHRQVLQSLLAPLGLLLLPEDAYHPTDPWELEQLAFESHSQAAKKKLYLDNRDERHHVRMKMCAAHKGASERRPIACYCLFLNGSFALGECKVAGD